MGLFELKWGDSIQLHPTASFWIGVPTAWITVDDKGGGRHWNLKISKGRRFDAKSIFAVHCRIEKQICLFCQSRRINLLDFIHSFLRHSDCNWRHICFTKEVWPLARRFIWSLVLVCGKSSWIKSVCASRPSPHSFAQWNGWFLEIWKASHFGVGKQKCGLVCVQVWHANDEKEISRRDEKQGREQKAGKENEKCVISIRFVPTSRMSQVPRLLGEPRRDYANPRCDCNTCAHDTL